MPLRVSPSFPNPQQPQICFQSLWGCCFPECPIRRIIQCGAFQIWHLYLSITLLRVCGALAWISSLFLFAGWVVFHCMDVPQLTCPLTQWRTTKLFVICEDSEQSCYKHSCRGFDANVVASLEETCRGMTAGAHRKNVLNFMRNWQTPFQRGCTTFQASSNARECPQVLASTQYSQPGLF